MLKQQATAGFFKYTLSFDDMLLVPKFSDINSRGEIDLTSKIGDLDFKLPIISSPMDTVTEVSMAKTMSEHGGLGIIHRYNSISEQVDMAEQVISAGKTASAAIGVSGDYLDRARCLVNSGVKILCVDVAHGHHSMMKKALGELRDVFGSDVHIIAGNIAIDPGYIDLASWGADAIRVGIGGGSICSTRIQTGHGVPTFQSISACSIARKMIKAGQREAPEGYRDVPIIADGGIKNSGDIVKSLAIGADFVMLGSMLAATSDTPGQVMENNDGDMYKVYRGMASTEAQIAWRGAARSLEGVSTTIKYKGSTSDQLDNIKQNVRSGLSYSGARNIPEFRERCELVVQTAAGQSESSTHIFNKK
jgi:IMP dehydrogenase